MLLACCATRRTEGSPPPGTHSHRWAAPSAWAKEPSPGAPGEADWRGGADESGRLARSRNALHSWRHHGNRWPAGGGSQEWGSGGGEPCRAWECGPASESNGSWEPPWKGSGAAQPAPESGSASGIGAAGHEDTPAPSPTGPAPSSSGPGSSGRWTLAGSVLWPSVTHNIHPHSATLTQRQPRVAHRHICITDDTT